MSKTKRTISGRTVVITGAASGIGRALAERLSAHSCPVAIADIDEKGLKETEASLHGPALLRVLDVADAEAQRDFAGEVRDWAPQPIGAVFNNAGVASSSGETPNTIDAMGDQVAAFVNALGLPQVDVLGFSIGGYVAQSFVLRHPNLVRRLLLAGTGPRNGEPSKNSRVLEVAGNPVPVCEDFLFLFFSPSEASQAAGRAFWDRRHQRKDADPPSSIQTMKAQQAAIMEWREPRGERYADLKTIKQPSLVVNGNDDIMVPTINSFTLSQHFRMHN